MKKSNFFYQTLPALLLFMFVAFNCFGAAPVKQQYYEIKIYRISTPSQAEVTENYLKDAFIPAMHRAGIKNIGVFKPVEADTAYGKFIYVFIPFETSDEFFNNITVLQNDPVYQKAGAAFIDAPFDKPPFDRYESIFLKAFAFMPQLRVPSFTTPVSERIYELRSYESATEAKATKKIHMFNEGGEIAIFEKIGANAVFYGQVLLGSKKPRLMYMTTYADMKSREEHWKNFGGTTEWATLSKMEEYKNTVSKVCPYLLHPVSYSDF